MHLLSEGMVLQLTVVFELENHFTSMKFTANKIQLSLIV